MYILSDLYYGRLEPGNYTIEEGSEYERVLNQLLDLQRPLFQSLSPEQKEAYNNIDTLQFQLCDITEEQTFIQGFRMGARMILDVLLPHSSDAKTP